MHDAADLPTTHEDEAGDYQAVSPWAVAGLLLGLASVVGLFHTLLWMVPAAAILVSLWALRQIAVYSPVFVGRMAAMAGLGLGVMFGVAGLTSWYAERWEVAREAERFALAWFDLLKQDDPLRAHQLTLTPRLRRPFDEMLPSVYRDEPVLRAELHGFVEHPAVRRLLALGERAKVRLYETELVAGKGPVDLVTQTYAVSYEEEGTLHTFFLGAIVTRTVAQGALPGEKAVQWQIGLAKEAVRPAPLVESAATGD